MLNVAMAQLAPVVGDIEGNTELLLGAWRRAADAGADLLVATELAVTGYPPEDLLLKPAFLDANDAAVDRLVAQGPAGTAAVIGHVAPGPEDGDGDEWDVTVSARGLRNAATVIADGRRLGTYHKRRLPNYGVFDEARYFSSDDDRLVVEVAGVPVGVTICEDLWTTGGPIADAAAGGAQVVVNLNASPYQRGKGPDRDRWVAHHAASRDVGLVYVNQVGGQDDVVFDGDSMAVAADGTVLARGPQFAPELRHVEVPTGGDPAVAATDEERLGPVAEVWEALVLGVRDYAHGNGFGEAVLGLSGGIDSAVTAALAAAALGPDNVTGVTLPSPYTSDASREDAAALIANLGIRHRRIPITPAMEAFDGMLEEAFAGTGEGVAEENLQARIRGAVLMALSNKFGPLVLATGNKSEYAVGYATLYGDMVGGYAVLKDVYKTLVYRLAEHRNADGEVIPRNIIERAPTAELRPDQRDRDSLPPYAELDPILRAHIEEDASAGALVGAGHDRAVVERVLRMVDAAEYKRRQAPPGPNLTERAFGKDRRVPITTAWRG